MLGDARRIPGRVRGRDGDELGEKREKLALHQLALRIGSRSAVTAAVVFSTLRGEGGGIFWRAGRPQPGSTRMRPPSITIFPLTRVRTGAPCTRRPCHGLILLFEKSC